MPSIIMIFLSAIMFFVLVPGVVFTVPLGSSSKYTVAAAHAVIYGILGFFLHDPFLKFTNRLYL